MIRHAKYGYRGVIVGWDKHARAPEAWFKRMGVARGHWGDPFYAVLVDTRDRTGTQRTYVWEGNIELAVNNWDAEAPFTIEHPEISKYFKSSPETPTQQQSAQTTTRTPRYTPKDWLQRRYPKD